MTDVLLMHMPQADVEHILDVLVAHWILRSCQAAWTCTMDDQSFFDVDASLRYSFRLESCIEFRKCQWQTSEISFEDVSGVQLRLYPPHSRLDDQFLVVRKSVAEGIPDVHVLGFEFYLIDNAGGGTNAPLFRVEILTVEVDDDLEMSLEWQKMYALPLAYYMHAREEAVDERASIQHHGRITYNYTV